MDRQVVVNRTTANLLWRKSGSMSCPVSASSPALISASIVAGVKITVTTRKTQAVSVNPFLNLELPQVYGFTCSRSVAAQTPLLRFLWVVQQIHNK